MKLVILLSLIACGYAAKLDRAYLPPSSAATAGGSPGSLNAPVGPSGPSGFGQPSGSSGFPQTTGFGSGSGNSPTFGKSTSGPAFGAQLSGAAGLSPSAQYGQPGSNGALDTGFSRPAQNFGQGAQDYQRNQPQRAQAAAEQAAEILRYDNVNDGETFSYSFETSNGIAAEESGVATNGVQAQGAFSYSDDDGQNFRVTYTADENGYQPQGDHLPTPPPIPEEILKSIEINAQAAAAGTQKGAYNPNEDNAGFTPQQYNSNAPSSYGQGSSGSSSFNQPQGGNPSQLYSAPGTGASNARPQSGGQGFQPQGPAQQYSAPLGPAQQYSSPSAGVSSARPSNGFGQPQKTPSQLYGSPSNAAAPGANGAAQARPNSFGQSQFQSQGPSQQYGAAAPVANGAAQARPNSFGQNQFQPQGPSQQYGAATPTAFGASQASPNSFGQNQFQPQGPSQQNGAAARPGAPSRPGIQGASSGFVPLGPASNGFAPSGLASQPKPNQYQATAQPGFPLGARPQGPAQAGQAQDESGYQYDKPQDSFGQTSGRPSNQGPAGQYRPQTGAGQSSGSQGPFPRPNSSNAGYPTGSAQGPFGPSGPSSQSNFGPASGPNAGPSSISKGASPFSPSASSAVQGSYGPSSGVQGPSAFGPSSGAGQSPFAPSSGGSGQSFGPSSGTTGFGRPQSSFPNAGTTGTMPDSGYSYNQPGSQPAGSRQPQAGSNAPSSGPGQTFGGPRQPPSFSEEEGYKY